MRMPVPPELDVLHSKMQMNKSPHESAGRKCLNEVICPQILPDIPEAWLSLVRWVPSALLWEGGGRAPPLWSRVVLCHRGCVLAPLVCQLVSVLGCGSVRCPSAPTLPGVVLHGWKQDVLPLLCPLRVSGWSWCHTAHSWKFIFSLNKKKKKIPSDIPDYRALWLCLPLFINCNSSVASPLSNLSVSRNTWTARGGRCTPTSWRDSTGCGSRGLRAPTPSWPMRWVWERRCRLPSSCTRCIKRWVAVRCWIMLCVCGAAYAEAVTL